MNKILAIETSSDACSVAVTDGISDYSFHEVMPRQHSEELLGIIDNLLNSASMSIKNLDAVAIGCGPGSFTGVRLACSTAQAIVYSQNTNGIVVSSLEILASRINRSESKENIISLVDANMGRLYVGQYSYSGDNLKNTELRSIDIDAFNPLDYDEHTFFVGEGCKLVLDQIKSVSNLISCEHPSALELLNIAKERLENNEIVAPEKILPIYLNAESEWSKS